MSNISEWSPTAASNNAEAPNGFKENMFPSQVNDSAREVMAAVRTWYEGVEWRDWGHTVAFASATTFTIATDVTAIYVANRPIRCTDATTLYGYVASSSYVSPNTTVTVTLDSGSLSASLSAVALGPTPSTQSIPVQAVRNRGAALLLAMNHWTAGIGPEYLQNLGLFATVATKALTFALGTKALQMASSTDPIQIAFRNATLTTGDYTVVSATTSPSLVVPSGATLGFTAAEDGLIYVYAINNAGTVELAVSKKALFDESIVHTTTAISATADSDNVLYSTTARTGVAVRLVGRVRITTGAVAGEWDNAATRVEVGKVDPSVDHFSHPVLKSGTSIATTSGTAHDFTGIPPGVKLITIGFVSVSTNGTSPLILQIGDSGGIETTGYAGTGAAIAGAAVGSVNYTTGFGTGNDGAATYVRHGSAILTLLDVTTNTWSFQCVLGHSDSARAGFGGGAKALSATLDRIRATTVNGTDTFDGGSINILYE